MHIIALISPILQKHVSIGINNEKGNDPWDIHFGFMSYTPSNDMSHIIYTLECAKVNHRFTFKLIPWHKDTGARMFKIFDEFL